MTSEPHRQPTTASAIRVAGQSHAALRLRLKPLAPASGHLDGAWWPRSRDLAAELPALADGLADRLGAVTGVVYAATFWGTAPNRVELGGRVVVLEGLAALDTDTVHVRGVGRRRVDLLVIPPDATDTAADRAMTRASAADDTHLPAAILADAGVRTAPPWNRRGT